MPPPRSTPPKIAASLLAFETVEQVEALRVWSLTANQIALIAQIRVAKSMSSEERDRLLRTLQTHLRQTYQIHEIVLQLESLELEHPQFHPLLHQSLTEHVFGKTRSSSR
ncbi:MAG: hypothetical protein HC936_11445 [Leptolyngbyaceae cyanobacterium SU_3_3]|nr:hypothetical protein [Leptolyngbyaceae cyanobacterium SU_3_3]